MPIFNLKEIFELMDKVAQSGLGMLEIESSGMRLKIEGKRAETAAPQQVESPGNRPASRAGAPLGESAQLPALEPFEHTEEETENSWHLVTAPIVGTFYRSPNPEAEPFVEVGDRVTKGRVLCIIEAMKLLNEIESDGEGVIVKVYPQNGQPVEYGEKLFALKPA